MLRVLGSLGLAAALFTCPSGVQAAEANAGLTVFAAASTTNALTEIAKHYEAEGNGRVALSFASSSTLAKQIENGAPADVFLSANAQWMDYLEEKKLIAAGSRSNLLGNRIVFIVPASSHIQSVTVSPRLDLAGLLGKDGLLSVGDPAHVPVGIYAKAALERLDLWRQVEGRIAPAKDVRAGLTAVERAESPLGVVYASDVAASSKVRIAGMFPADSRSDVGYPAAATVTPNHKAALKFIAFMSGPQAKEIWKKYGFEVK